MERWMQPIISLSKWVYYGVAGVALAVLFGVSFADIIGIKLLNAPVPGGVEIAAFVGASVYAFAIAYIQARHGHVEIEILVKLLPRGIQSAMVAFASLIGLGLFAILGWACYLSGTSLRAAGEVSQTTKTPIYPFMYAIAFSCIPTCLVLIAQFVEAIRRR